MKKKVLGVFAENDLDRNVTCQYLAQFFSSWLDIVPITLTTVGTLRQKPGVILVNITSLAYADKYFPDSRIIFTKRFLNSEGLAELVELPEGTPVLVANKPRKIAEDTVENLQLIGINHLKFIPYWPGAELDTESCEVVAYAGFRSYCPEGKHRYIDLGYRSIASSVLAELIKAYDLPSEFLNQFQVSLTKQLVDALYQNKTAHARNEKLKTELAELQSRSGSGAMNRRKKALTAGTRFPAKYQFSDIRGHSPAVQKALRLAKYYATTDETILILGESGTGKELFAQSIHNASDRKGRPFIAVNCAAISDSLMESELFGYEEGAFTGARKGGKQGLFLSADTGTIFLDEIGDISLEAQSQLLRVLEEREIMPVGSMRIIPIDVRIICATNKNLLEMVREGTFQEALYYRLKVLTLNLPPLRERKEDIPEILAAVTGGLSLPERLCQRMLSYAWPGNVRELRAFSGNLKLFFQKARPEENEALLDELVDTFFEETEADAKLATAPSSNHLETESMLLSSLPLPAAEALPILRAISLLTAEGGTAGRKSLLPQLRALGCPLSEAKLKSRLQKLTAAELILVGTTRQGVRLSAQGKAFLSRTGKDAFFRA